MLQLFLSLFHFPYYEYYSHPHFCCFLASVIYSTVRRGRERVALTKTMVLGCSAMGWWAAAISLPCHTHSCLGARNRRFVVTLVMSTIKSSSYWNLTTFRLIWVISFDKKVYVIHHTTTYTHFYSILFITQQRLSCTSCSVLRAIVTQGAWIALSSYLCLISRNQRSWVPLK